VPLVFINVTYLQFGLIDLSGRLFSRHEFQSRSPRLVANVSGAALSGFNAGTSALCGEVAWRRSTLLLSRDGNVMIVDSEVDRSILCLRYPT
jgi:hypothetical protein